MRAPMTNTIDILMVPPPWLALVGAAAFALLAYQMRWLTQSGAVSTFAVGWIIYGLGGGRAIVPLLAFFLSSSLLSKLGRGRKAIAGRYAKKRDHVTPRKSVPTAAQLWPSC